MWPQTLQMSEDDCRSTLRRIELETYANVIGAFRAQGGLNDKKAKLLEELRSVFHISQDRHRAEARRVANDEHLSTIAKVVSGPNTWQEWSREGRRSYPMLPRVAPQTALGWIANNLAAEAAQENSKLPYPTETAAAAMEEQAAILAANAAAEANGFRYPEKYVVTSDPFKMPDIPASGVKKNLKRGLNDGQNMAGVSMSKKRNTDDMASFVKQKQVTASTAAIQITNSRRAISLTRLQQQRFFYQQQQKAKKLAKTTSKREKLPNTNKSGRKSKKLKEQLNQELMQGDEIHQQQRELVERTYEKQMMQQLGHLDASTNNPSIIREAAQYQHIEEDSYSDQKESQITSQQKSYYMPLMLPQIASSKRDITRNLTKLQLPGQMATSSRLSGQLEAVHNPPTVGSPIVISNKAVVEGKVTPLSTPVQKYIVEDRQPPISVGYQTPNVATASTSPSSTQQITTSQYLTLSTPNKMRTLNTTILPPGTKLSTSAKKLSGATILSATVLSPGSTSNSPLGENISNVHTTSQLYNLHDGGGGGGSSNINIGAISSNSQQQPTAPTHTPPAVIQLHSNDVVRVGSHQPNAATTSTQSKVLTTKILPIVLSGKADNVKNGGGAIVSSASFVTTSGTTGSNIIKSLPSTMFVSSQQGAQGSSSPIFSSFSSTGQVYRKHPNILKSTSSALSRNPIASGGGPQILSNIRVTPPITTAATANSNLSIHQTQSSIFQQPLRTGTASSTSGIRTSVKICQSPNGKVFIQPANLDPSKLAKLPSGHISQRILPGTLLGTGANLGGTNVTSGISGSPSSNQPGSPHRIAIQKVQIIPAPLSSNVLGNTTHSHQTMQQQQLQQQQRVGSSCLTIGTGGVNAGKGGIFVPRSAKTPGTITLSKAAFSNTLSGSQSDLLGGNIVGNVATKAHSDIVSKSSNVVVIDPPSTANKTLPHHTKLSSLASSDNISRSNLDSSQMITEDTPVDIIVENSANIVGESSPVTETSSITAVLASNMVGDEQQSQQKLITTPAKQSSSMVPITVLNATDWEMELDQATAASLTHNQRHESNMGGISNSLSGQFNHKTLQQDTQMEHVETADTIIIDDSFEDVIIEEEEHEDAVTENEHFDEQHNLSQQEMDIETSGESEVVIMDNTANLDERLQMNILRNSELIEKFDNVTKKTNMSVENTPEIMSLFTERRFEDAEYISDGNMRISLEGENIDEQKTCSVQEIIAEENASNTSGLAHGTLQSPTDNNENIRATDVKTETEDAVCNNHDKDEEIRADTHVMGNANVGVDVNDSNVIVQCNKTNNINIAEANEAPTITAVSASLYSVKSGQNQGETISKVQDKSEEQKTFECSQEAHFVGKKNDGLQATDQ